MTPRNVETRNVETSGTPERGNLEAAAPAVGGCRSGCGLYDFANRRGIVKLEHPAPIIPEPKPLSDCIPPDDRRDAFHGMIGSGCVQFANLAGGLAAAPIVQLCGSFDDHGRIIPGRGNERNTGPAKREFSNTNCPPRPPIVKTPREIL